LCFITAISAPIARSLDLVPANVRELEFTSADAGNLKVREPGERRGWSPTSDEGSSRSGEGKGSTESHAPARESLALLLACPRRRVPHLLAGKGELARRQQLPLVKGVSPRI